MWNKLCVPSVKVDRHKNCLNVDPLEPPKKLPFKKSRAHKSFFNNKETVLYFTREGAKEMIVPSKRINYYPITLKVEDVDRMKARAVVLTEKDRLKIQEDAKAEHARQEYEREKRKNEFKQYDKSVKAGGLGRLSALERESRDKANYLLKRAWELRKEDEDDVKKANSLILQAKCQAIRDAQLAERKLIQKELKEEEKRVEQIMFDQLALQTLDERKRLEQKWAKERRYVMELNAQVEEIQANRLFAAEQQIEERRKANEAMFVLLLEELEGVKKKEEEKRKTREMLNLANDQIKRALEIEKEEERINDLKIKEYIRQKTEREERFERQLLQEKKRKDLERARQRAVQAAASDLQKMQEEMNTVRRQEEYEREWRRKEKEEVRKRMKMEEDCRLAREQQLRDINRYHAMERAREKVEFEKNLKVQIEWQEKDRLSRLKRQYDSEKYREQLLKQINMKERERIEERQEKFQEGVAMRAEEAKKRGELKQILERKFEQMRQHKVPEQYMADILRHFNLC